MKTVGYTITDTTPEHIRLLGDSLRAGDRHEITCMGLSPRKALWRSYRQSIRRRTGIVDGQIAACWGLGGGFLDDVGQPWLMTSPAIEKIKMSFAREARAEVHSMLEIYPRLEGYVAASYGQACGFLRFLGFELGNPIEIGAGRELFYMYRMER